MKKVTLLLGALSFMALVSCKKEVPPPPPPVPAEVPAPPPPPPAPEVPATPKEGTSVEVSKDGVNVSTKSGEKTTEVKVGQSGKKSG